MNRNLFFYFLITIFLTSCASIGSNQIEKPNSALYQTLEDLVKENDYLVLSYTLGKTIENYTYDIQMESTKSFNAWSWTGTSEEINCFVTVRMDYEIVAQIYSSDEKNKALIMSNGYRGKNNGNVIFLYDPSKAELIDAYNRMMIGKE